MSGRDQRTTHPHVGVDVASEKADNRRCKILAGGEHVVVIGAGPAGLTLAYLLARQGKTVTILEASETVGGISQTARYKDYRFDIGGHRFFTKIAPVQSFWEDMLGDELIDVPRLSRILYNGTFFDYPLKAMNALTGLGPVNAIRILGSYCWAKVRPSKVEDTFAQWVTNRFGHRLYDIFFRTYTEKVWGIDCTEIRAEWAAQRIQGLSLGRAILAATALQRRDHGIKSLIQSFRYPRLGPGQLWETCRDRFVAAGGQVHMQHRVSKIECVHGQATAVECDTPNGPARFEADHIVSTTDLRALIGAMSKDASALVQTAAKGLRYRDFLVVALILDRESLFPDNWIYIHTPGVRVGRIQNFNNWSAAMIPDAKRTCLGMEYFCFEGDGLWTATDAELITLASRELEALGLAKASDVIDGTVVRTKKAYPIYDSAYHAHLAVVRAFLDKIENVHTIGRNGMHKYNNQDHSMYTAMLTAENMLGVAEHDVWSVNTDFEYLEEQRVATPASTLGAAA